MPPTKRTSEDETSAKSGIQDAVKRSKKEDDQKDQVVGARPSQLLSSLASHTPAETFVDLIAKEVSPALDRLPEEQRSDIVKVLLDGEKKYKMISKKVASIGYDKKNRSFYKQLKALNKDIKQTSLEGWLRGPHMMQDIVAEITHWLPDLWSVAVEGGTEFKLVRDCLSLCKSTVRQMQDCSSITSYDDLDCHTEIEIKDSNGNVVYSESYGGTLSAIEWVWKELLVAALANGKDERFTRKLMSGVDAGNIRFLLRDEGDDEEMEPALADKHWSDEMKAGGERLKNLLESREIEQFKKRPTYDAYSSLPTHSPARKESLLDFIRGCLFATDGGKSGGATVSWKDAVSIFIHEGANDDLVRLLESNKAIFAPADKTAQQKAVSHLVMQSDPYRKTARATVEKGLSAAETSLFYELVRSFPNIDQAWKDLKVDLKKLETSRSIAAKAKRADPSKYNGVREDMLESFGRRARNEECDSEASDDDSYDSDGQDDEDYEERMRDVDADDSDFEGMHEALCPDIQGPIQNWMDVLQQFPDREEVDEVLSKFGQHELYTVEGAADHLAFMCENSSAKCHLADGIRRAFVAFGRDGPEKDKMKGPLGIRV